MNRAKILSNIKRVVVKVGSRVITSPKNELDLSLINSLAEDIQALHNEKCQILVVSSGAIVAGIQDLKLKSRPADLSSKQATSAVGQVKLMHSYSTAFKKYNTPVAQILLTREDLQNRHRYLNAKNTLNRLLEKGVIPVINENDTVAVEEIKFGDNDTLSALVTLMMDADLLAILTSTDGLYTDMPRKNKKVKFVPYVEKITPQIEKMAKCKGDGAGGMETKIQAAKILTQSGIPVVIANGRKKHVLKRIIFREEIGTFFFPAGQKKKGKKKWIAFFSLKPKGQISVDKGAKEALVKNGKSLLPSGIISVKGKFAAGDLVSVVDKKDKEFARGMSNYGSDEIEKIKGLKSSEIKKALSPLSHCKFLCENDEIIHRDNLTVL
jgi:glutamate 5-kinase